MSRICPGWRIRVKLCVFRTGECGVSRRAGFTPRQPTARNNCEWPPSSSISNGDGQSLYQSILEGVVGICASPTFRPDAHLSR